MTQDRRAGAFRKGHGDHQTDHRDGRQGEQQDLARESRFAAET